MVALLVALAPETADAATLADALAAAEAHSTDLGLIRAQSTAVESVRGQAWSATLPKVQASASYTVNQYEVALDPALFIPPDLAPLVGDVGDPIVIQPKHYIQASVSVIQPLLSGSALPLLRGAYAAVDAQREDERAQTAQLRMGVARAYYGLLAAREAEAIATSSLETARSGEDLARRSAAAGLTEGRSVLQAQLLTAQTERDVRGAVAQRIAAEEAFNQLTGLARDTPLELPDAPTLPVANADEAVAKARESRPDLQAAEARVRAATNQRSATALSLLPSVNGRFTEVYSENTGFSGENTFWVAAVEGTWTLFDGGYTFSKTKEASAQLLLARLASERAEEQAEGQVRSAWANYERAASALASVDQERALAEENERLTNLSFQAGNATFLELQTAQLQVGAARLNQLVERMNRDLAVIDLHVAVGNAW